MLSLPEQDRREGKVSRPRTIHGFGDRRSLKGDTVDDVVVTPADGADGQAMPAGAVSILENNVLPSIVSDLSSLLQKRGCKISLSLITARLLTVPELTATQSSWLYTVAFSIRTVSEEPMSKASVFFPRESPAEASILTYATSRFDTPLMLKTWTGGLRIWMFSMSAFVRECAWKNLGFVLPPLLPSPSQ